MCAKGRRRSECASRKYQGIFEERKKYVYKILRGMSFGKYKIFV
jgi:hypothetical protein